MTRTQVGIIGAGPAGLFLAHLLAKQGIDSVILEGRSQDYVLGRVRAGVLEPSTVASMALLGLDGRLKREGIVDDGLDSRFRGRTVHMNLPELTGHRVVIYGQQEVVKDLIAARIDSGAPLIFGAEAVAIEDIAGRPAIIYVQDGVQKRLECDFVAACDGYHGIGRASIPADRITLHERQYGFAWLGVLSRSPPLPDMTYSNSDRGFALCSRRSWEVSRLYLQVGPEETPEEWPAARFWDELHHRMFDEDARAIVEGEIFQTDVAQLRAFIAEPMQHGRLFLAGDAAHIVPPTGAKGLNLAVGDARLLARALGHHYATGSSALLEGYSQACLDRVWKAVRFSTALTGLLHRMPGHTPFERALQLTELEYTAASPSAQKAIAEQYVGIGIQEPWMLTEAL